MTGWRSEGAGMSGPDRFERDLRAALSPEDPGAGFAARVLGAVRDAGGESDRVPGRALPADGAGRRWRVRWLLPLAAAVALTVTGAEWVREHREQQRAAAAKAQVLQALRMTSQKLNVVHGVVDRRQD